MESKKYTLEELQERYEECMKQGEFILKQIEEKKKEEEKKLAKIKDTRKKEIDDGLKHLNELVAAYIKDYGSYEYEDEDDDCRSFPYRYHYFF